MKKLLQWIDDYVRPKEIAGEADIDISAAVYTAYVELLKIEPRAGAPLSDVVLDLDLNKATTGWDTVSTGSDTLDIAVFSKIDGTNYRHIKSASQLTAVGNGSHATAGVRLEIGAIGPDSPVSIRVKLNAERDDVEIPYRLLYKGDRAPSITAVAAA